MELNDFFELLFRWLHIVPAIILVGGTAFLRFAVCPTVDSTATEVREQIRRKWARLVMLSILALLISGLYNGWLQTQKGSLSGFYVTLLLAKIVLAFAVFFFASVLSGRSERAKRFRTRETFWLNVLFSLMLATVMVAGLMKVLPAGIKYKTIDLPPPAQTAHEPTLNHVSDSGAHLQFEKKDDRVSESKSIQVSRLSEDPRHGFTRNSRRKKARNECGLLHFQIEIARSLLFAKKRTFRSLTTCLFPL